MSKAEELAIAYAGGIVDYDHHMPTNGHSGKHRSKLEMVDHKHQRRNSHRDTDMRSFMAKISLTEEQQNIKPAFDINNADPDDPELLAELAYAKRMAAEHGTDDAIVVVKMANSGKNRSKHEMDEHKFGAGGDSIGGHTHRIMSNIMNGEQKRKVDELKKMSAAAAVNGQAKTRRTRRQSEPTCSPYK